MKNHLLKFFIPALLLLVAGCASVTPLPAGQATSPAPTAQVEEAPQPAESVHKPPEPQPALAGKRAGVPQRDRGRLRAEGGQRTGARLASRTALGLGRRPTRAGPTRCMTCAVLVFFEYTRPSRNVIGCNDGGVASLGCHTPPPANLIEIGSSINVIVGDIPIMNAAP